MKKCICILLILLLLTGCGNMKDDMIAPVNFYYCNTVITYNSSSAVVSAEVRESAKYADDLTSLINFYFQGPISSEYSSPFPAGTEVLDIQWNDETLQVVLSPVFAELKGLDLSIACTCLTKTLLEVTECKTVTICVNDTSLDEYDCITMDESSVLLLDESF